MNPLAFYLLIFISISFNYLQAQVPTIQDCLGAIPICQQIYMEELSPSGTGNYSEIAGNGTCATSETNSIWYTFTTNQSGEFGFVITPNNATDDYDWWMFDITNTGCVGINSNPVTSSCNVAGGASCDGITGANGLTGFMMQGPGCGADNPDANAGKTAFNDLVMVEQGNTYVLCVSNWTGSPFGYTIDFGLSGNIGILDEIMPEASEVIAPPMCGESVIEVIFSENIQCSTIDNFNFQLDGPGASYSLSLSSDNCNLGGDYDRIFELMITPPIQSLGNFTLTMTTDSSTEVLDLCDNPANSDAFVFTVSEPLPFLPIEIGKDTALVCEGDTLLLDVTFGQASYQWQDGFDEAIYEVTESGVYSVSVTNSCGVGMDTIEVTYLQDAPEITFGNDTILCDGENLVLDVTTEFGNYIWQDGSDQATFTVEESGTYVVTISNSCKTLTDSITIIYTSFSEVNLGQDTAICAIDSLVLDASNTGATYLWQDGSTAATFLVNETGQHAVTVTNACGETTDEQFSTVTPILEIDLGVDTVLCPQERLTLNAFSEVAESYTWHDQSSKPEVTVVGPGSYQVVAINACETVQDEIFIRACEQCITYFPNAFSPNNDGINDYFRPFSNCDLEEVQLQIFDRWGSLVFESFDENKAWDGRFGEKLASIGVYIWKLNFKVVEDFKERAVEEKGDVLLVR